WSPPPGTPASRRECAFGPPELVELLITDPEVMSDLVNHRDGDLLRHLVGVVTMPEGGPTEDRDRIRQRARRPPSVPFRQRGALVDSQQVTAVPLVGAGFLLHEEDDVIQLFHQLAGN